MTRGHCLCGQVTFEFTGSPLWCGHCHCESCRRATASPFTTWIGVRERRVPLHRCRARRSSIVAGRAPVVLPQLRITDRLRKRALAGRDASLCRAPGASRGCSAAVPCARGGEAALDQAGRWPAAIRAQRELNYRVLHIPLPVMQRLGLGIHEVPMAKTMRFAVKLVDPKANPMGTIGSAGDGVVVIQTCSRANPRTARRPGCPWPSAGCIGGPACR